MPLPLLNDITVNVCAIVHTLLYECCFTYSKCLYNFLGCNNESARCNPMHSKRRILSILHNDLFLQNNHDLSDTHEDEDAIRIT